MSRKIWLNKTLHGIHIRLIDEEKELIFPKIDQAINSRNYNTFD